MFYSIIMVHELVAMSHEQLLNVCLFLISDWCGPLVSALVKTRYIAFSEGWALYAEYPLIANETGKERETMAILILF